jgi:fibro-slime domain-containing protein
MSKASAPKQILLGMVQVLSSLPRPRAIQSTKPRGKYTHARFGVVCDIEGMQKEALSTRALSLLAFGLALLAAACGSSSPSSVFDASTGGSGDGGVKLGGDSSTISLNPDSGDAGDGGATLPTAITATIRDFRFYDASDPTTDPDFENPPYGINDMGQPSPGYDGDWDDPNVVTAELGSDGTPVYAGDPTKGTLTTYGNGKPNGAAANFAAWYHDTPGTNITVKWPVPLVTQSDGSVEYDSAIQGTAYGTTPDGFVSGKGFFPIDDGTPYATAFGNQGWPNNYSFTNEIHTVFVYRGGEYFNFRGDDDVYVYINNKRVINLGGVHGPETANVQVDTLGLTVGQEYPLDFFSAERHVTGSNILFQTTLALRAPPPK